MATLTINYTSGTYIVDGDRPTNHGVFASSFIKSTGKASLIGDMVSQLNALNTLQGTYLLTDTAVGLNPTGSTVALANAATVTIPLSTAAKPYTLYRTTSDGTISGAVLNFPTTGLVDGSTVSFITSGVVTTVTGTLSSAPLPVLSATVAGQRNTYVYNLAATTWFRV